jgi:hypothetical protein
MQVLVPNRQIIHLRFELARIAQEHSFNLQHPRVIQASQHLDNLIVQYQNKETIPFIQVLN